MKAKDVIKEVCVYLGKEEILSSALFEQNGEQLTTLQNKDVNKMLKCLNNVINEIASDYIPLLSTKKVTLSNCQINVFDIDANIQEIIELKTAFDRPVKYKIIDNKIVCLTNSAVVTYKKYPQEAGLNDDIETFGGRLSARVLAYGVASEFYTLEMLYEDALIWENRFKNSLLFAQRKKGEIKLKKRGWF